MTAGSGSLPILIAVHEEEEATISRPPEDEVQEEGVQEFTAAVRRVTRRRVTPQSVDLDRLSGELDQVETQVEHLLHGREDRGVDEFRLTEVEVGLGVSAEGSIGVVTAGVQASITLHYSRD